MGCPHDPPPPAAMCGVNMTLECADLHDRGAALSQWVCHISGQGKKWKVIAARYAGANTWMAKNEDVENDNVDLLYLPKSEYSICEPPEQWRDITHECLAEKTCGTPYSQVLEDKQHVIAHIESGYRLKKVTLQIVEAHTLDRIKQTAFLIEKKETP